MLSFCDFIQVYVFASNHHLKSTSLSLIRLWGKVVYNVEKSYVDRLAARKPRDFNLFITSHEFLIDQKRFLPDLS